MNYLKRLLPVLTLITTLVSCESYIDKDGNKRFVMFESSNNKAERYKNQGGELLLSDNPEAALEKLQVSAGLNPTDAETFYLVGVAYAQMEKYQECLENCNKALQINNKHIGSMVNRGFCYSKLGERELAISDFNDALNTAPNNVEILRNRGIELNKMGQKDKACEDIKRAKELGGDISEELFDLICK